MGSVHRLQELVLIELEQASLALRNRPVHPRTTRLNEHVGDFVIYLRPLRIDFVYLPKVGLRFGRSLGRGEVELHLGHEHPFCSSDVYRTGLSA